MQNISWVSQLNGLTKTAWSKRKWKSKFKDKASRARISDRISGLRAFRKSKDDR